MKTNVEYEIAVAMKDEMKSRCEASSKSFMNDDLMFKLTIHLLAASVLTEEQRKNIDLLNESIEKISNLFESAYLDGCQKGVIHCLQVQNEYSKKGSM